MQALRYFFEERCEIAVIAAGSFLEFLLSNDKFVMPVGRIDYLHMGPLVFTEYLPALNEENLLRSVQIFSLTVRISSTAHVRNIQLIRSYRVVGGRPEAEDQYAKNQNFRDASNVNQSIIDTYRDDFPKYIGSRNPTRMIRMFSHEAKAMGKNVKYSSFSRDDQCSAIKGDFELQCLARILTKVTHSHCNRLFLLADGDERVFKILLLDVGLAKAVLGLDRSSISRMDNEL